MLTVGQTMSGFTVHHVIGEHRAGRPDGAVIVGYRKDGPGDGYSTVVARVDQRAIDDPEPAREWANGDYDYGLAELGPALREALVLALTRQTSALDRRLRDYMKDWSPLSIADGDQEDDRDRD
jgi:hypothetical protein